MNLVIGVYCGYGSNMINNRRKGGLYFFLHSLRKVNSNCKIIVLCRLSDMFPELITLCNHMKVEIMPCIPNNYNNIHLFQRNRFTQIHDFLMDKKAKGEIYEKILMSDLADVIFQEDPFGFEIPCGIYPAAEQNILSDITNDSSTLNMGWIQEYSFLEMDPRQFDNKYVICCGTIIGYYAAILEYLNYYNHINPLPSTENDAQGLKNDQAVMNIFVYHHLPDKIQVQKYTESKILTLDKIRFEDLDKNEKGQIVNKNNELYAIIHQIDRCNLPYMMNLAVNG